MKAKKVNEFVQRKDIKANVGIDVLYKKSIEEWFAKWAPDTDYVILTNLDIYVYDELDLIGSSLTYLPDNLRIGRYLDLDESDIIKIPKNLRVNNRLYLNKTKIKEIPSDMRAGRSIELGYCKNLIKLPDNFRVEGGLDLNGCENLTELPIGLYVVDKLDIRNTGITKLPKNLTVRGWTGIALDPKVINPLDYES